MLYIKLFIEREKNTGQSAPECPFKVCAIFVFQHNSVGSTRRHQYRLDTVQ